MRVLAAFVVAAVSVVPTAAAANSSPRLDALASRLAGKPVTVVCLTRADLPTLATSYGGADELWGFSQAVGANTAYVSPLVCPRLLGLLAHPNQPPFEQSTGRAALVFAHEIGHLTGIANEGATECYALRNLPRLLRWFGVTNLRTKQNLEGIAELSHENMPAAYRAGCP